jgi:hypothetical protein
MSRFISPPCWLRSGGQTAWNWARALWHTLIRVRPAQQLGCRHLLNTPAIDFVVALASRVKFRRIYHTVKNTSYLSIVIVCACTVEVKYKHTYTFTVVQIIFNL